MVAAEALLISLAAVALAAPISVLAARLEQGLFTRVEHAAHRPPHRHRVASVRRRPRRRGHHDTARRLCQRPPRLAHPPHRCVAREHRSSRAPSPWREASRGWQRPPAESRCWRRPAAVARAPLPPRQLSGWSPWHCSDRSWRGRSRWLHRDAAERDQPRARAAGTCQHPRQPAPCRVRRDAAHARGVPRLHPVLRQDDARAADDQADHRAHHRGLRTRGSHVCRPSGGHHGRRSQRPGRCAGLGLVRDDGNRGRRRPPISASTPRAPWMRPRSQACWISASAQGLSTDLRGASLAVSTDRARQFGWRAGERVHVLLGDGTADRPPRRRDLRPPARIRRHPPAPCAGRSSRHAGAG